MIYIQDGGTRNVDGNDCGDQKGSAKLARPYIKSQCSCSQLQRAEVSLYGGRCQKQMFDAKCAWNEERQTVS